MNNKNKYLIVALVTIGFLTYLTFFLSNSESKANSNSELVQEFKEDALNYIKLADSINSNLDTSFYAQYRVRPDSFYFFYLSEDKISESFRINRSLNQSIFEFAKELGITKIWKYDSENFYRFEIKKSFDNKPQVIVLRKDDNRFIFRQGSNIQKAKIVSGLENLPDGINLNVLFKLNDRVLIYL